MSRDHRIVPTAPTRESMTVRLGAGSTLSDRFDVKEQAKAVKLVAESRYDLCVAGDAIDGFITSVEAQTQNGFSIGGVALNDTRWATADGLQATPGTGVIAVGDYVLAGAITAKGTALVQYAKVTKATSQPGVAVTSADNLVASINVALASVAAAQRVAGSWRVVSLGTAGTGAVGTAIVIRRAAD